MERFGEGRGEAPEWRGFRIRGRVQGVGFRWWTRREAGASGIRGFVRNCADGSVQVRAWGPPTVLDAFRARLQEGPSGSRVTGVEEEGVEEALASPGGEFEIRG